MPCVGAMSNSAFVFLGLGIDMSPSVTHTVQTAGLHDAFAHLSGVFETGLHPRPRELAVSTGFRNTDERRNESTEPIRAV